MTSRKKARLRELAAAVVKTSAAGRRRIACASLAGRIADRLLPGRGWNSGRGDPSFRRYETFAQITETWSVPSTVPSFATVTSQAGLPVVSEMAYDNDTVLILTPGVELVVK
jgi:hypothetical protein